MCAGCKAGKIRPSRGGLGWNCNSPEGKKGKGEERKMYDETSKSRGHMLLSNYQGSVIVTHVESKYHKGGHLL